MERLLQEAALCYQHGRPADAAAACRRLLATQPGNPRALHLLGMISAQSGSMEEALALFRAVTDARQEDPMGHCCMGHALRHLGRWQEALASYERALLLAPNLLEAHEGRGIALGQLGRYAEGLSSLDRALALNPSHAELHYRRGLMLVLLARHGEAVQSFRSCLASAPVRADVHYRLGVSLGALGRHSEALESFERTVALTPGNAEAHYSRGLALAALGRHEEALRSFDAALAIREAYAEAHGQRGVALQQLGRQEHALTAFRRAIALSPDLPDVYGNCSALCGLLGHYAESLACIERAIALGADSADAQKNRGNALKSLERYREALASYDRALELRPGDPEVSYNKAMLLLLLGEFTEGWRLYEQRLRAASVARPPRSYAQPRWTGREELSGKVILVYAEQGFGDTLQFSRYVSLLQAQARRVIFEAPQPLLAILRSLGRGVQLVGHGEQIEGFDYHCPLMSLPAAFGTELATIPAAVPYLRAEPRAVERWAEKLRPVSGLRIGIAWQGNPVPERSWARGRSVPLEFFRPLASSEQITLVSLQKGPGVEQLSEVDFGARLIVLGDELDSGGDAFVDTAAVMANLDLIITSDTAIPHLAGALGVPVWLVLQAVPSWHWLLERNDSPWYPTMRLFRQPRPGDWRAVFAEVGAALEPQRQMVLRGRP